MLTCQNACSRTNTLESAAVIRALWRARRSGEEGLLIRHPFVLSCVVFRNAPLHYPARQPLAALHAPLEQLCGPMLLLHRLGVGGRDWEQGLGVVRDSWEVVPLCRSSTRRHRCCCSAAPIAAAATRKPNIALLTLTHALPMPPNHPPPHACPLQGLLAVMLVRLSGHLDPLGMLWLAVEAALCVASIACELTLHSRPNSRLAHWREVLAALWVGSVCGRGRVGQLLKAAVDSWQVPPGNLAVAAVVLLFASNVTFQMMIWAKPLRLRCAELAA